MLAKEAMVQCSPLLPCIYIGFHVLHTASPLQEGPAQHSKHSSQIHFILTGVTFHVMMHLSLCRSLA